MRREDPLPTGCDELAGKIHFIRRVSAYEYSSSCPNCGGDVHNDGTQPDRFRIFLNSKATGNVLAWCRRCGFKWWPGKQEGDKPSKILTPEQVAVIEADRKKAEEERLRHQEYVMTNLQREKPWDRYHDQLTDELADKYYTKRLINPYFIEVMKLGYCHNRTWFCDGSNFVSDSLTIPIFENVSGRIINLRHRLITPSVPNDKYRPEMSGLPANLYIVDYERKLSGKLLIVEGEFKALTVYITADDPDLHVVGLPSCSPEIGLLDLLKDCEPVYIALDPGTDDLSPEQVKAGRSITPLRRLADYFGARARIIKTPYKIDDMCSGGILKKDSIRSLMNTARKYGR